MQRPDRGSNGLQACREGNTVTVGTPSAHGQVLRGDFSRGLAMPMLSQEFQVPTGPWRRPEPRPSAPSQVQDPLSTPVLGRLIHVQPDISRDLSRFISGFTLGYLNNADKRDGGLRVLWNLWSPSPIDTLVGKKKIDLLILLQLKELCIFYCCLLYFCWCVYK